MFCLGGSLGSALGAFGWSIARWDGVYGIACFMLLVALVFYVLHSKRIWQWRASALCLKDLSLRPKDGEAARCDPIPVLENE